MNLYPRWWRKHFLIVEMLIGIIVGTGIVIWDIHFGGSAVLDGVAKSNRGQMYGTLASICGSLLGFVITAMSLVLGFASQPKFQVLRSGSQYRILWKVFKSTIHFLGICTVAWLFALAFDRDSHPHPIIVAVALGVSAIAAMRLARSVWVLGKVVEISMTRPRSDSEDESTHQQGSKE
jgi:hypothetical protein